MIKVSSTFQQSPLLESDVETLVESAVDHSDEMALTLAAVAEKLVLAFGLDFIFGYVKRIHGALIRIESVDAKRSCLIECETDDNVDLNALLDIAFSLTAVRAQLTKAVLMVAKEEAAVGRMPVVMPPIAGDN